MRIFTSGSQKLIPKAVLKWEGPYFHSKKKFGNVLMEGKKLENGFTIVFSKMDLYDVGGYFHIWGLKIGTMVHMYVLKSPIGVKSVV